MRKLLLASIALVGFTGSAIAQSQQQIDEIRGMHWQRAAVALPTSHSRINKLPGFSVVTGPEAHRFRQMVDGSAGTDIEADALNLDTNSEFVYSYVATGFVRSDDWSAVNPDALLKSIQANDDVANQERIANKLPTLRTVGWIRQPTLNNDTHMVSWIIEAASSDGSRTVNAVVLKLGRQGFERIIWVTDAKTMAAGRNDLSMGADAHQFDQGARYEDYQPGTDRAAEYGVAGLVAGALGVKLVNAVGVVALLAFAKKGLFLLVLPFIWLWRKLTGAKAAQPVAHD